MTVDRLALAVRVRKARRRSVCPSCRSGIEVGNQIAKLADPPAWIHVGCVAVVRQLRDGAEAGR
jgi:hypothetical protein